MKIVLIRPSRLFTLNSKTINPSPPLGMAFIAAALEHAGHHVSVIDAIAEGYNDISPFSGSVHINGLCNADIIKRIPADVDLIGFSCMFTGNWMNDRLLINEIGSAFQHAVLMAGGEHITAATEIVMKQCPCLKACILGEGEDTAVEFCDKIANKLPLTDVKGIVYKNGIGEVIKNERRDRVREIEAITWPAWHLFPTETYFSEGITYGIGVKRSLPVMATRGCPYSCTFCSSPEMWGRRYNMRSPINVVDELEYLKRTFGVDNVDFYDLTAIIKEQWIIEFAKELIKRDLNLTWQIPAGTRSEAITREVAHYLKISGCRNITYAPESGSVEILKAIKKKVSLDKMLESISYSNKEGLNIKINMIIGLPEEYHRNIWQTMWFLVKCSWYGVYDMSPAIFLPYPGTELFNQLQKAGKVNLEEDDYYFEVIKADNVFNVKFYNYNINSRWLNFYRLSYLWVFYVSNFIFRPGRFFVLIKNVVTLNPHSRGEALLVSMLKHQIVILKNFKEIFFKGKKQQLEIEAN
jgi:anaerobic magnesium-protoporphyrin IX monomethyl ester cyclase